LLGADNEGAAGTVQIHSGNVVTEHKAADAGRKFTAENLLVQIDE
jgi:hypothetical protein